MRVYSVKGSKEYGYSMIPWKRELYGADVYWALNNAFLFKNVMLLICHAAYYIILSKTLFYHIYVLMRVQLASKVDKNWILWLISL